MAKKLNKSDKKEGKGNYQVKDWLERLERASKVKEQWRDSFRVALGYDFWEGRQRPPNIPASEWVTINLIYSNLMSMLPSLYNNDPYFYVKLKRSHIPNPMSIVLYEKRGKIRQSMINYLKEELNLKTKTRLSIMDAIFQFGVMKVHYETEMVENPDAGQPMVDENSQFMIGEDGQVIIEPKMIPTNEAYRLTRIHPDDFLVDEDAGPLDEDVTWKAQRIKRNIDDVKKDKRLESSARTKLKATEISDPIQKQREHRKKGTVSSVDSSDKRKPDTVVLWEIYDLKEKRWLVVAEGCEEFMVKPEKLPVGTEDDPFVDLRFTKRDDSWYPLPAVSQWIDPQKEYCELRSKLSVHRKRFNRKYLAVRAMISEDEVRKLEIGDDGTICWTEQPGEVVTPIKDAPLDQNHIQELALLRDELTLLAVGPNQRQSGRGVESATEADIIERRLQVQEGDWIGLVIDFVRDVARKLDQLVQAYITQDQAIKVTGPQGDYWELVSTQDYEAIEGEFEYSVNVGATTPKLPEIERAQWLAFLTLLASAPQLALSKRLLTHQAELHHIDDEILVEEIHQMAVKMMSGQIPMPGTQGSSPGGPGSAETGPAGMAMGMANFRGGQ
uniref:Putative head tail connector protein n=1 Tax=viral metagenome TaxID=1070528 RepID=A0A6M3K4L2_9ZZZZ